MSTRTPGIVRSIVRLVLCTVAAVLTGTSATVHSSHEAIATDDDDIAGVVSGAKGPEAGVWVIAETRDLDTPFVRIVVTDDQGRYLLPDLVS